MKQRDRFAFVYVGGSVCGDGGSETEIEAMGWEKMSVA